MTVMRRHNGRILYRKNGETLGCEDFHIDVRENGRTIRAYCEMVEGRLTRDASWSLDAAHMPIEGCVRVIERGEVIGSSWYRFTDNETECEAVTRQMGRISQRLPGKRRYLGLHPLVGDGMIALARGRENIGEFQTVDSVTCSYDIKGESGLVALPIGIDVSYAGREQLTVAAGAFEADRYELRWQPHWPAAQLWVHGEDAVFLRLAWEFSGLDSQLERLESRVDGAFTPWNN